MANLKCTIDHDGGQYEKNPRLLYYRLKLETSKPVQIHRSCSGRGYHYIIHGLTKQETDKLRQKYDDPTRYHLDKISKIKPKQVLWTKKTLKDGTEFKSTKLTNKYQINNIREIPNPWK